MCSSLYEERTKALDKEKKVVLLEDGDIDKDLNVFEQIVSTENIEIRPEQLNTVTTVTDIEGVNGSDENDEADDYLVLGDGNADMDCMNVLDKISKDVLRSQSEELDENTFCQEDNLLDKGDVEPDKLLHLSESDSESDNETTTCLGTKGTNMDIIATMKQKPIDTATDTKDSDMDEEHSRRELNSSDFPCRNSLFHSCENIIDNDLKDEADDEITEVVNSEQNSVFKMDQCQEGMRNKQSKNVCISPVLSGQQAVTESDCVGQKKMLKVRITKISSCIYPLLYQ